MAGLGFKDFQVGEVLTSSDVDGYLMQQTVMRFADSGARGSALGTAVGTAVALAEGMISYLADTNTVEIYNGTNWVGAGGVSSVQTAFKSDTFSASVAAGAGTAVTGLSVTHAMSDSSNRLLISAYVGAAASGAQSGQVGMAVADGTAYIGVGDADGSRTQVMAGIRPSQGTNALVGVTLAGQFVYEPGDTANHTYTLHVRNLDTATRTLHVNKAQNDSDDEARPRASSALVIQEVTV